MSYARFGFEGSNVYVYSDGEQLHCCMCRMEQMADDETDFCTNSRTRMALHLSAHRAYGHTVPESAFERLRLEAQTQDLLLPEPAPPEAGAEPTALARWGAVAVELVNLNGPCRLHPAMDYAAARLAVAAALQREHAQALDDARAEVAEGAIALQGVVRDQHIELVGLREQLKELWKKYGMAAKDYVLLVGVSAERDRLKEQVAELQEIALLVKREQLEVWPDASQTNLGKNYVALQAQLVAVREMVRLLHERACANPGNEDDATHALRTEIAASLRWILEAAEL